MIIVSQDRDNIINFDKIKNIWIDDNILDKTNTDFEICADGESLGHYKTEEKAKEVLQEIQERYEHTQYLKCFNRINDLYEVGIKDFAYEMPEE